jgi:hypothetical protein
MRWFLTKTQESRFKLYKNFILKPRRFPLGLYQVEYKNWEFWNNKSKEQLVLNLISQYGVQKYFSLENAMEWICVKL